jgi:hypothetical protein
VIPQNSPKHPIGGNRLNDKCRPGRTLSPGEARPWGMARCRWKTVGNEAISRQHAVGSYRSRRPVLRRVSGVWLMRVALSNLTERTHWPGVELAPGGSCGIAHFGLVSFSSVRFAFLVHGALLCISPRHHLLFAQSYPAGPSLGPFHLSPESSKRVSVALFTEEIAWARVCTSAT